MAEPAQPNSDGVFSSHDMPSLSCTNSAEPIRRGQSTDDARKLIIKKLDDGPYRFPAFWPPLIDWAPDHNWGGMGMIGLQEMLMQTVGDQILLLPAWPKTWDVDFKLHAYAIECDRYMRSAVGGYAQLRFDDELPMA